MSTIHGKFGWYELMTTDVKAAGEFYNSVVGWTTQDVGGGDMPYTTFNVNGAGVAGMLTVPGARPGWLGYIHVADTDEFAARIEAAGGSICKPPTDVPGMLRFCVVTDPQGAAFVLFTSNPSMPTPPNRPKPGSIGTVSWHELMAADLDSAWNFYSSFFGWTKTGAHDMGAMGAYQMFAQGEEPIGGMMTKPPQCPASFWGLYFHVDSVKAAVGRIEAAGGKVAMGPHEVPTGQWIVQGIDPQGVNFALVSDGN